MRVLCIGGCHWDRRLIAQAPLLQDQSTPVLSHKCPGGVAANVARTMRSLGIDSEIASIVGYDTPEQGPYLSVQTEAESATYITIEQTDGTLVYGLADTALYERMDVEWVKSLNQHLTAFDAVVVDANLTADALSALVCPVPLYALAVSPAKAPHLIPVLEQVSACFFNQAEAAVLGGQALALIPQTLITKGPQGCEMVIYGESIQSWPAPQQKPAHVNGLGDRLAALSIAHHLKGHPFENAVSLALEDLL